MGILGVLAVVGFILWAITSGCNPDKGPKHKEVHSLVFRRVVYNDDVWEIIKVVPGLNPVHLHLKRVVYNPEEENTVFYVPELAVDEILSVEEGRKYESNWTLN